MEDKGKPQHLSTDVVGKDDPLEAVKRLGVDISNWEESVLRRIERNEQLDPLKRKEENFSFSELSKLYEYPGLSKRVA